MELYRIHTFDLPISDEIVYDLDWNLQTLLRTLFMMKHLSKHRVKLWLFDFTVWKDDWLLY